MINNCIASFWINELEHHVSWSGKLGWQTYYHYWLVFDYRSQLIIYLIGIGLALKWPLEGAHRRFAITSILAYTFLFIIEISLYLWHGTDRWSEEHYYYFIGGYTFTLFYSATKEKIWR